MKAFRKLFVWEMNVKLFMSLYFIAMLISLGLITLLSGGDSLHLLTMLEMLLACAVVATLQTVLLDDSTDYSHGVLFGRSSAWVGLSTLLVTVASLLLDWFVGLPNWSVFVFAGIFMLALVFTLLGLKLEQDADTVRLNEDLHRYKNKA